MKKLITTIALFTLGASAGWSQNIGINTTGNAPDQSAGLDVDFTDKGVLIPRVALVETTNTAPITAPATALLVYNTATANDVTPGFYYWDGTVWIRIGAGSDDEDWEVDGNDVYTGHGGPYPSGNVGIGTTNPIDLLHVDGNLRVTNGDLILPTDGVEDNNGSTGNTDEVLTADGAGGVEWKPLRGCSGNLDAESFEGGAGSWTLTGDMQTNNGGTSSGNTGPDAASDGSEYIYAETSSGSTDWGAEQTVDLSGATEACISFDYHMYFDGATDGVLELIVDGNLEWSVTGEQQSDNSDPWSSACLDLSAYAGNAAVPIEFNVERGTQASDFEYDVALDNIQIGTEACAGGESGGSGLGPDDDWEVNGNDVYTGHGGTYPSGNVGIGTTAPNGKLDIRGGDLLFNEDGNDIDVRMETQNRVEAFYLDASKDLLFLGDNFGDYQNGNTIDGEVVDYVVNMDNGGTTGTAVGIGSIEYFLDRSGETTINNRFSPSTDGGEDLGGTARRWDEVFAQNGTINTSDRRDKKDIENLNYGLDEVMQLKPVAFNWKDELSSPDQKGKKKLGLIAQDLHQIVPEVVKTKDYVKIGEDPDTDEPIKEVQEAKRWGVFYSDLIPVLIKALQEEDEKVEALKAQIEAQNDELNALNQQLDEVEALKAQNKNQQALIEELSKRLEKLENQE